MTKEAVWKRPRGAVIRSSYGVRLRWRTVAIVRGRGKRGVFPRMPIDLSYSGIFKDVFMSNFMFVFVFLGLFVYRLLAVSCFPRLCDWKCYLSFFAFLMVGMPLLFFACAKCFVSHDVRFGSYFEGLISLLFFLWPWLIVSAIELHKRCRWRTVLLSFVLELLAFPVIFFVLFALCLIFDPVD